MKIVTLLLAVTCCLSASAFSQIYKAKEIYIGLEDNFQLIDTIAYLDYNLSEKYVELIFNDSVYYYRIKKTPDKPEDEERFVVWFKKSTDTMLWNLKNKDQYFFSFKIGPDFYWFKKLSGCSADEIKAFKNSFFTSQ